MEETKSAESRVNMVSLFDFGLWMGGTESNILELGKGYTELTEDWAPNTSSVTYVNMETAANTLNGYDFSMTPEREYISDEAQKYIDKAFRTFPTGSKAASFYYRFYKTDRIEGTNSCIAIRVPVIAGPSSTGGAGGETLTSSIQINGNGKVEEGAITVVDGVFQWSDTVPESPARLSMSDTANTGAKGLSD